MAGLHTCSCLLLPIWLPQRSQARRATALGLFKEWPPQCPATLRRCAEYATQLNGRRKMKVRAVRASATVRPHSYTQAMAASSSLRCLSLRQSYESTQRSGPLGVTLVRWPCRWAVLIRSLLSKLALDNWRASDMLRSRRVAFLILVKSTVD